MRNPVRLRHAAVVAALAFVPMIWLNPETVADVALTVAAVFSWMFTLLYVLRSAWWVRPLGRVTVSIYLVLSLVLTQNSVSVWWGQDYPWRGQVRGVLYVGLGYALVKLIVALRRIQTRT
jgi:hypothetical protein